MTAEAAAAKAAEAAAAVRVTEAEKAVVPRMAEALVGGQQVCHRWFLY